MRSVLMLKKYIKQWIMGSNKEVEVKRMTIDEIKSIYFQYDCSLFGMDREYPIAYQQYMALKLPKKIVAEWKKELLTTLFEQLKETGNIAIFMRIDNVIENFVNKKSLFIYYFMDKMGLLPSEQKLLIVQQPLMLQEGDS